MSALAGLLTVSATTFVPENTVVWMGGQPNAWVKIAQRRVIDGLCCTQGRLGLTGFTENSWQAEPCLCIRSVPWQQRWPMASWAVLGGAQPGACGEGLSSHPAPAGPHLHTVFL